MTVYHLPANLDTRTAPQVHAALNGLEDQPVSLDGSQVESLGGQCLQILLAAHAAWTHRDLAFAIQSPSEALCAQWAAFGAPADLLSPLGDTP